MWVLIHGGDRLAGLLSALARSVEICWRFAVHNRGNHWGKPSGGIFDGHVTLRFRVSDGPRVPLANRLYGRMTFRNLGLIGFSSAFRPS